MTPDKLIDKAKTVVTIALFFQINNILTLNKSTCCGKNQLAAILAGALVTNGLAMAAKVWPNKTNQKLLLMNILDPAPRIVKSNPNDKPTLVP